MFRIEQSQSVSPGSSWGQQMAQSPSPFGAQAAIQNPSPFATQAPFAVQDPGPPKVQPFFQQPPPPPPSSSFAPVIEDPGQVPKGAVPQAFLDPAFEYGKVPEQPPTAELCR